MLRNFINTIKRFTLSSVLNLLGLTVAFTAFIVIMMQVTFDNGFDRFHPKSDRIYKLEVSTDSINYQAHISRFFGEAVLKISPYIKQGGVYTGWGSDLDFKTQQTSDAKVFNEYFCDFGMAFPDMLNFEFIEGNDCLNDPDKVIMPLSIAQKIFPGESAIGKTVYVGSTLHYTVGGVYKDLPKNTIFGNYIYKDYGDRFLTDKSEWSTPYYLELTDPKYKEHIEKLTNEWCKENFQGYKTFVTRLTPIGDIHYLEGASKTTTTVLFGVAILILLIAAINFLNFAIATTPQRLKSINMHKILGSTVAKLRIMMVMEAVMMAVISFGLALLAVHSLCGTTFAGLLSTDMSFGANSMLIITSAGIAILTGVLAGIFPAFYSTSFTPALVIKGSFGMSPAGKRFRTILISFQYVISIVLIICSLFMIVQNDFMKNHPVGFNRNNLLCANLSDEVAKQKDAFNSKLLSNPIIKGYAYSAGPVIATGRMGWGRTYKGERVSFECFPVSWDYLRFMGMEITKGRDFTTDDELKETGSIIFNEKAVEEYGFEVGEKFEGHSPDTEIIGVARNFNFKPMQFEISPIALYVFGSKPWWPIRYLNVRVEEKDTRAAIEYIRKTILEFDPSFKNVKVTFLDEDVGRLYEKEDKLATLISLFGLTTMLISLMGVFGLVIFETQYRRGEIGLRKINGATVGGILMMFNRKFIWIVGICFVISLPIAWYGISKWMEGFAYRTPLHWWVFAVGLLTVLIITVLTVTIQSWRAATENPVKSIKSE